MVCNNNCNKLQDIAQILEWLAFHCIFGSIDCKLGYWQVLLELLSRKKKALKVLFGLFKYERVLLRLKSAPSRLMRCIDTMMQEHDVEGSKEFVDNLLIGGVNIK